MSEQDRQETALDIQDIPDEEVAAPIQKHGRILKTYRLIESIPDGIRPKSAAMAILKAIEKHGSATRPQIRAELPKNFKEATLGFYLGKFQREHIVRSE